MTARNGIGITNFLVHTPAARMPLLFSLFARLPGAAIAVLLPLLGLANGMSATVSASTFAACRIAQALSGPAWGKVVDRVGLTLIVPVVGGFFAAAIALLAVTTLSPVVLIALAVLIGALTLPMSALMRALWNRSLRSLPQQSAANSVESLMSEVVLLLGRIFVALLALVISLPYIAIFLAILAAAGSFGLAATALVRTDRAQGERATSHRTLSNFRSRLTIFVCFLLFSGSLGAYSLVLVFLVDTVTDEHEASLAALAVAVWGVGSMVGLTLGRLSKVALSRRSGLVLLLVATAGLQLLAVAGQYGPALLLTAAFVAGLPLSAVLSGLYKMLGDAVPVAQHTEYFAWATTMIFAGDALGALAVGFVTDLVTTPLAAVAVATTAASGAAIAATLSYRSKQYQ